MRVLIRADSSVEIGAGHVSRCEALAGELFARGVRATLLTRDLAGSIARPSKILDVMTLAESTDAAASSDAGAARIARDWLEEDNGPAWLVVDHYGLDAAWEMEARSRNARVMVIDDLADRGHACELLLDQNLGDDASSLYAPLVPRDCRLLLGPRYALLRPAFGAAHTRARVREDGVKRVLLFFGGSDAANMTTMAIEAVRMLSPTDVLFDVVVGGGNPHAVSIASLAARTASVILHYQTGEMAALMLAADLSVGAGGTASWERCAVGLPALVIVTAENQRRVVLEVSRRGACANLGDAANMTPDRIAASLQDAFAGRLDLAAMSRAALGITDGRGAGRVAEIMLAA